MMRYLRYLILGLTIVFLGCDGAPRPTPESTNSFKPDSAPKFEQSLREARQGFVTQIVSSGDAPSPPDAPSDKTFQLVHYPSKVGQLAAYLTPDRGDAKKRPAIIWITGGDNNSIGDVWTPQVRKNDQSACAFRKAGIVMMFPSLRGGNDNPGKREGFYGEVDDILAASDYLAGLSYVDPDQIYLGGHSTGATLVMLVGACTDRYRAIFALGPVAMANQYGGRFIYCDPTNKREIDLRSPMLWMHCMKKPLYVFEGAKNGNWDAIQAMLDKNSNPNIQFFQIPGHDHFSVIAPLTEKLAERIVLGDLKITSQDLQGLK